MNYYISNSGSDSNPGTQVAPWATLDKINSFQFSPGDTVYFKCGDVFRGLLYPDSGNSTADVTYASYGSGDKPIIMGSVSKNDLSDWTDLGDNIWQAEAVLTPSTPAEPDNLIVEENWYPVYTEGTGEAGSETDITECYYDGSSSFKITCVDSGANPYDIQFYNAPFKTGKWKIYTLTIAMKGSVNFTIPKIELILAESPFTQLDVYESIDITTDWQEIIIEFYTEADISNTMLDIVLGGAIPNGAILYIDKQITLKDAGMKLYNDNYNFYTSADATQSDDASYYYSGSSSMKVDVTDSGDNIYAIQIYNGVYWFTPGKMYKVTFAAKSTETFTIPEIFLSDYQGDYRYDCIAKTADITTDWQEYEIYFTVDRRRAEGSRFQMNLGNAIPAGASFYLDKYITFTEIDSYEFYNLDVGNIVFGETCGVKKTSEEELSKQNDFYSGNNVVKMYSVGNPASLYPEIELCKKQDVIQGKFEYSVINGLKILYSGAHGINTTPGTNNIEIINNTVGWIGGSFLIDEVRYGNGIQIWESAHDILIKDNDIYQVYDAAITNQGTSTADQYNINILSNKIEKCEMSYEVWLLSSESSMSNINFKYNKCNNSGYGWSHNQRPDPNGCHLLFYANYSNTVNVNIANNIFNTATDYMVYGDFVKDYIVEDNKFYLSGTEKLYYGTVIPFWAWIYYLNDVNNWTDSDNSIVEWTKPENPSTSFAKPNNSDTEWR